MHTCMCTCCIYIYIYVHMYRSKSRGAQLQTCALDQEAQLAAVVAMDEEKAGFGLCQVCEMDLPDAFSRGLGFTA